MKRLRGSIPTTTVATTKVKLTAGSTSLEVIPTAIECKGLVKLAAGLEFLDGTSMTTAAAGGGTTVSGTSLKSNHSTTNVDTDFGVSLGSGSGAQRKAVSIGGEAGVAAGPFTVSIGYQAGKSIGSDSVAIGREAASNGGGGAFNVLVGRKAGQVNCGSEAVAVGNQAGGTNLGTKATIVGASSGSNSGTGAASLGFQALSNNAGNYAIGVGYQAGRVSAPANSITLNATGDSGMDDSGLTAAFKVAPIRGVAHGTTVGALQYDTTSKEVTYSTTAASGGGSNSTVAFRAYHNAHESPSSNQIEWKFESFDEGSNFSVGSGNGVFTAPETGFYFFTLRSMCNVNDNTSLNLVVKVNGTLKSQATIRQPMFDETGQGYGELNTLLSLAANDEVTAHFDGSNFTALLNAEVNAEFSGFKV